jgi:hypothetical protein
LVVIRQKLDIVAHHLPDKQKFNSLTYFRFMVKARSRPKEALHIGFSEQIVDTHTLSKFMWLVPVQVGYCRKKEVFFGMPESGIPRGMPPEVDHGAIKAKKEVIPMSIVAWG